MVWEKEELDKEQIRGVFAIGVLATLFGYQTIKNQFGGGLGVEGVAINFLTIVLGGFWGIYITCTAFSMLHWSAGKKEAWLLNLAKIVGFSAFFYGSVVSVLLAIVFAPFMVFASIQQNPTFWLEESIVLIGAILLIVLMVVYRYLKRKKAS